MERDQELKARNALKHLLQEGYRSHLKWTDEQFDAKLKSQYPETEFLETSEIPDYSDENPYIYPYNLRFINNYDGYARWVVYNEVYRYEDSIDSMGPAGLDTGAKFEDFHEDRQEQTVFLKNQRKNR